MAIKTNTELLPLPASVRLQTEIAEYENLRGEIPDPEVDELVNDLRLELAGAQMAEEIANSYLDQAKNLGGAAEILGQPKPKTPSEILDEQVPLSAEISKKGQAELPGLRPTRVIKALGRLGFEVQRQSGSHVVMKNEESGEITVVPFHKGRDIHPGLLRKILTREAHVNIDDFLDSVRA